jgi:hypothetical protein
MAVGFFPSIKGTAPEFYSPSNSARFPVNLWRVALSGWKLDVRKVRLRRTEADSAPECTPSMG